MIYAQWIVKANKLSKNRFEWLESEVLSSWMPFFILPKETKLKYIVFEKRWDEPIIQDTMNCCLEFFVKNKWIKICNWNFSLNKKEWYNLAELGYSITTSNKEINFIDDISPLNLYKYTGTEEDISKESTMKHNSYLDYKK
jgi:hypothetical protein